MTSDDPDRENVPPDVRTKMLWQANHRCQSCGGLSAQRGGHKSLEIHHHRYDPEEYGIHDEQNLTVFCVQCHNWLHKMPDTGELPIEVSEEAASEMLPHDFEIISLLHKKGLLSTTELRNELEANMSYSAIQARCWSIMGLPEVVSDLDEPWINQDVKTGKWGLFTQIDHPERGRIPESDHLLMQRIHDERVYQAYDRTGDDELVAKVFDITTRTVKNKKKRAQAYQFPLDALESNVGRPAKDDSISTEETDSE